ncbi:hypothetical protein RIR_jg38623.t1 [Rhizophagus irregularis DAOM 181602=DAOM 197198]|nr:hypothetical protein RIR_jg38623.t1 [Rhizophagus irregularis DAOM 181602=DAOM 197198]
MVILYHLFNSSISTFFFFLFLSKGPQVYIYKKRRYYGGKPAYRKKKDLKILKKKIHDPIYNDSDIQSLVNFALHVKTINSSNNFPEHYQICLIDKYTQKIEDTMMK